MLPEHVACKRRTGWQRIAIHVNERSHHPSAFDRSMYKVYPGDRERNQRPAPSHYHYPKMSALQLPNLPSVEGLPDGYTEHHPNGTIARSVARYFSGSIEDRYYRPDGTIAQWVSRWPNGHICDHYYNPDETKAVTIRYVP